MTDCYKIIITEIKDKVRLHLEVKRKYPFVYKIKTGLIKEGEFMTAYGIDEAQKALKILTEAGAAAKIEK